MPMKHRCPSCKIIKPLAAFGMSRHTKNGRHTYCRQCISERRKADYVGTPRKESLRWRATPEVRFMQALTARFGRTFDARELTIIARRRSGECDICGGPPNGSGSKNGSFHIDHDHETGAIRGLLCGNCNHALGKLGDDIATLRKAIAYLQKSSKLPKPSKKISQSRMSERVSIPRC